MPGQEVVYGAIQALWSAAAQRRFRDDLDEIEAFCLFIGYPRSGHRVIGAMLNAHRHANDGEVITIRHEEFIRSPASTLAQLCEFLGLLHDPDYLAECISIVFERPTGSRRLVAWSPEQVGEVDRRARHHAFLHDYQFELTDTPEGHDAGAPAEAHALRSVHDSATRRSQSFVDRVVASFNPRVPADASMDSGLS